MNSISVPPRWIPPKIAPVSIAATGMPSERRNEVKTKPRKNISSAIGAMTQTSSAMATSAAVEPSAPSSSGRSSVSWMSSAIAQT